MAVGNGAHESRFSGTVLAAETITVATLKAENSSVKQYLGTISERELAVAKVLSLFLIFWGFMITDVLRCGADDPFMSNHKRIGGLSEETEMRSWHVPLGNVEGLGVKEISHDV